MNREVFEQRLARCTPDQEEEITALVEEYRNDLNEIHDTAVSVSRASSDFLARILPVLSQLGETAVATIEDAIKGQAPIPDTYLLLCVADGVACAEGVVTTRLKAALRDKRPVPQPPEARFMEEFPPSPRICDDAYVGLRQILHAESSMQFMAEAQHFLFLPEEERDGEIASWLQTGMFTKFLDDVDVEEE